MIKLPFFKRKKNQTGFIGIDVQPQRIAIAHILQSGNTAQKPVLKQCRYQESTEKDIDVAYKVLSTLIASFPIKQFLCNTSVYQSAYELLLVEAPDNVESDELLQAMRWRIKDQLAYHIDDAVIDVFEIPGQGSGRAQLMYVVASQKQDIDAQVASLQALGLSLHAIDINELIQRNVAAILPEDKEGVVMLRLNEDSGLLTITRNGTLYLTRSIDFGCQRLEQILQRENNDQALDSEPLDLEAEPSTWMNDEDLALSMDEVDEQNAVEETEPTVEPSGSHKRMDNTLNEQGKLQVDELILEIQRSLDYYISHFRQRPVKKIVIAPLKYDIAQVLAYMSDMLGTPATVLDFNDCLEVEKPIDKVMQNACFEAIGLALRQDLEWIDP